MAFDHWLKRLSRPGLSWSDRGPRPVRRKRGRQRPTLVASAVERLEPRTMLTTFVVDSLDDAIADDGVLTLREALVAANSNTGLVGTNETSDAGEDDGDAILFQAGLAGTIVLDAGFGSLAVTDDLLLDGTGANVTIDAGGNGRVLLVDLAASPGDSTFVTLRNLVLAGGDAGTGNGGGILFASRIDATLDGVTVADNVAASGGGVAFTRGSLTVTSASAIVDNTAGGTAGSGGGVYFADGTLHVVGESRIEGNTSVRAGGGVAIVDGTATLRDAFLRDNAANGGAGTANPGNGGGLHVAGVFGTRVTLEDTIVGGNEAAGAGGGLWNQSGSTISIVGGQIVDNVALGDGGGGLFDNGGTIDVSGLAIVSGNRAPGANGSGGGVRSIGGTLAFEDATVRLNEAVRAGGGIAVVGGTLLLVNTNLDDNDVSSADDLAAVAPGNGGGLHVDGGAIVTIDGGTVSGNAAGREGRGIWNGSAATLLVRNGTAITGNSTESAPAPHDGGGGIFNDGGMLSVDGTAATVTITANVSRGNPAATGGGLLSTGGIVSIASATISGNEAVRAGGGIAVVAGELVLVDVARDDTDVSTAGGIVAAAGPGLGGGLHVGAAATVTITRGTIRRNTAELEGGGIWNAAIAGLAFTGGTLIAGNSTAVANDALDGGGGLFNDGGAVVVDDTDGAVRFEANTAGGGTAAGGAILSMGGILTVAGATITGNEATRAGGGVAVANGTLVLDAVALDGNDVSASGGAIRSAAPGNGGGLHVAGAANVSVIGGSIDGNTAGREGGGIWISAGSSVSITGTTISGNATDASRADDDGGGGLFNDGGTVTITGAAIEGNTATAFATLVVNEFLADPPAGLAGDANGDGTSDTSDDEFVEIVNLTGRTIDLSGWTLRDASSVRHTFAPGTVLETGEGIVVFSGGAPTGTFGGSQVVTASSGALSLGDAGDTIVLADAGGLVRDRVDYGAEADNGQSRTRDSGGAGGFVDHSAANGSGGSLFSPGTAVDGGDLDTVAPGGASGGGVLSRGGSLAITNTSIANNEAIRAGGGIEIAGGTLDLVDSILEDNDVSVDGGNLAVAGPGLGGGLHTSGEANVTIRGGTIRGNLAGHAGGGISNSAAGTLAIEASGIGGTLLEANSAAFGGGLHNAGGTVSVDGAIVRANVVTVDGGGILNAAGGLLLVVRGTIAGNDAAETGGGLWNAGSLEFVDGRIGGTGANESNRAATGGGLFNGPRGNVVVERSAVVANVATADGGGIASAGGTVALENVTVSGNTAGNGGGGLHVSGDTLTITSSTVEANSAAGAGDGIEVAGGTVRLVNAIVAHSTGGGVDDIAVTGGTLLRDAGSIVHEDDGDPLLDPLAGNGGPTPTHALRSGSPALDSADAGTSPEVDQRGLPRPQGAGADVGSFESADFTPRTFVGLGTDNTLHVFDEDDPTTIDATITVTGLAPRETILGLDVRPADGALYVVTDFSRFYTVDLASGAATLVSTLADGLSDGSAIVLDNLLGLYVDPVTGFYDDDFGGGERWLRGVENAFGNDFYFLLPSGEFFAWSGVVGLEGTRLATFTPRFHAAPELLYEASSDALSTTTAALARSVDEARGLYVDVDDGYFFDDFGAGERWLRGNVHEGGNTWYILLPNGDLLAWDGTRNAAGTLLASLGVEAYRNPALVHEASAYALPVDQQDDARRLDEQLGLVVEEAGGFYEEDFGGGARWLEGVENAFGNKWYFVRTNGELVAWNGTATLAGSVLFDFDDGLYANLDRLYAASQAQLAPAAADLARSLDEEFGLDVDRSVGLYFDTFGSNERWLRGLPNADGNPWYILLPNGDLLAWNGTRQAAGTLLGNLGVEAYRNPELVHRAFRPTIDAGAVLQPGTALGVDFDPVADELRIVADNERNLRANVDTGDRTVDEPLHAPFEPNVVAAAYGENLVTSTASPLLVLDSNRNSLSRVEADGALVEVGSLGVDFGEAAGFDVFADDEAFATLRVGGTSRLYTIDLDTGAATAIGRIGDGRSLIDLAVLSPDLLDDVF